jgi:hypothetical protein
MVAVAFVQRQGFTLPFSPLAPAKPNATVATYVYEKDDGAVPAAMLAALDALNKQGIKATVFEDDDRDADGDIPDQYKVPHAEATKVGLPQLVRTAGDTVVKVVRPAKDATVEQILEAVK